MTRGKKPKKKEGRRREAGGGGGGGGGGGERRWGAEAADGGGDQERPADERASVAIASVFRNDELQEIRNTLRVQELTDAHTLFGAVVLGKFDIVKKLLKEGFPIDSADESGWTAVMWAVKSRQVEMVELLGRRGASITTEDAEGNTAVSLALLAADWEQNMFLDLWNAVKDSGLDLNKPNKGGRTVVHLAVRRQWHSVLEALLEAGADVDRRTDRGATALMLAASRHYSHTTQILLYHNADYALEDQRGCTALCYSIAYMIQKKLDKPDTIVETLLSSLNEKNAKLSVDNYLRRRLELLNSPPQENFGHFVLTVVVHVITFFMRFVQTGALTLLNLSAFRKIRDAVDKHIEDADYVLGLLTVLVELLRHCPCCMYHVPNDRMISAFTDSGVPNALLRVLKRHGSSCSPGLLHVTFLPLAVSCSHPSVRGWLQASAKHLLPPYKRYTQNQPSPPLYNYYPNEEHSSIVRRAAAEFKLLVGKLQKGEVIYTEKGDKPVVKKRRSMEAASREETSGEKTEAAAAAEGLRIVSRVESAKSRVSLLGEAPGRSEEGSKEGGSGKRKVGAARQEDEVETYWPLRKSHQEPEVAKKKVRSRWQEEFKEGCELFGISLDGDEGSADEAAAPAPAAAPGQPPQTCWELEVGSGDKAVETTDADRAREEVEALLEMIEEQFANIRNRFEDLWRVDYERGYPDATDRETDLLRLMQVLPGMEEAHMAAMDAKCKYILSQVREKQKMKALPMAGIKELLQEYSAKIVEVTTPRMPPPRSLLPPPPPPPLELDEGPNLFDIHSPFYRHLPTQGISLFRRETGAERLSQGMEEGEYDYMSLSPPSPPRAGVSLVAVPPPRVAARRVGPPPGGEGPAPHHGHGRGRRLLSPLSVDVPRPSSELALLPSPLLVEAAAPNNTTGSGSGGGFAKRHVPPPPGFENSSPALHSPDRRERIPERYRDMVRSLRRTAHEQRVIRSELIVPHEHLHSLYRISEGGNFGQVVLGLDSRLRPVAVREMGRSGGLEAVLRGLMGVRSSSVLPYSNAVEVSGRLLMATPLCERNLGEHLALTKATSKFTTFIGTELAKQLLRGLHFLHTRQPIPIIHGNLKPTNILIDSKGRLRLAEFGLHRVLYQQVTPDVSSLIWWSQETYVHYQSTWQVVASRESDIQSAGMVVHSVVTGGVHPFGRAPEDILSCLVRGHPMLRTNSPDCTDLLSWMLMHKPQHRPNAEEIVTHVFMWDEEKRWKFIEVCAGINSDPASLSFSLGEFHSCLDHYAKVQRIQTKWMGLVEVGEGEDTLSGLLAMLRATFPACTSWFLKVFPSVPLTLYRLLEHTPWMLQKEFREFREPN